MNGSSSNHRGVGVQVRGLRKSFDGQEVLRGLDFEVPLHDREVDVDEKRPLLQQIEMSVVGIEAILAVGPHDRPDALHSGGTDSRLLERPGKVGRAMAHQGHLVELGEIRGESAGKRGFLSPGPDQELDGMVVPGRRETSTFIHLRATRATACAIPTGSHKVTFMAI